MNFTLDEISQLLCMRENPTHIKKSVRELAQNKLNEVKLRLTTLSTLRNELTLLINLRTGSKDGCPIIDDINKTKTDCQNKRDFFVKTSTTILRGFMARKKAGKNQSNP